MKKHVQFPKNLILYDKTQDISINQNQTKYPYIESLRKEIINLDKKAKIFNKNITNKINIGNKEIIKEKKPLNITLLKQNNLTMMSEEDVTKIISDIVAQNETMVKERQMGAMGPLMGMCMKELKGKADGGLVNKLVREEIQKLL